LSRTSRNTLGGIMHASASASNWDSGAYVNRPDECAADQFPRAFAGYSELAGYYGRQIHSSDYGTYRTQYGGHRGGGPVPPANPPQTNTLAANSSIGASVIKYTGGTWHVDDWILIDTGANREYRQIVTVGTSGSGGTGLTLDDTLIVGHTSGASITEANPPSTVGGGTPPSFLQLSTWTILDLVKEVKNTLRPRNGGTGNQYGWGLGVLFHGYNSTGSTIPINTLVRSLGFANMVEPTTTLNEADVLGVVVGYFDGLGNLIEQDCPDQYDTAVLTAGVTQVLTDAHVGRGDFAFASGTDGLAVGDPTAATGMFGQFLSGGPAGVVQDVRLFGPGAAGTGGGGGTTGTPALTFSTTNSAGAATTLVATDATIAVFDATAPVTQAMGDSAAAGSAGKAARRDHKHGMPAFGSSAAAVGASSGGSATTPSKSDHVHATGAGTPTTIAFGDAAATGTGPAAAMTDHRHGMAASPTVPVGGTPGLTFSTSNSAGSAATYVKTDATIAIFDGTVPTTSSSGDAAATGSAGTAAHRDHVHGRSDFVAIEAALSNELSAVTTASSVTFRAPCAFTLTGVRASLKTAQATGSILTVDVRKNGTTVLSTTITIDNTELTSVTAATPPVISVSAFADDDVILITCTQIGDGTAIGLKATLLGTKP
jgi:hypothetical protein